MAIIRCGNCKAIHDSVDQVKACYAGSENFNRTAPAEDELLPCEAKAIARGTAKPVEGPTEKQLAFIAKLRSERNLPAYVQSPAATKQDASDMISALLEMPRPVATQPVEKSPVPEGYYAIDIAGTVKFYRVDCPTEGKWAGRTFLSVQASDDFHPIKNAETRHDIFRAILAQGIQEAQRRYGVLIGRCGICNRTLTDETSRAYGIGPVCREKGC
jgi:hypothetical protein